MPILPILTGAAGLIAVALSLLSRNTLPVAAVGRAAGSVAVLGGMALVLWATAHLGPRAAAPVPRTGEPARSGQLVTSGPYRFVRHPIYLGLTMALVGVALTGRSAAGLAATLCLYLPGALLRVRSEESTLARRFGRRWAEWASRTPKLLPGLRPTSRPLS